MVGIRINGIEYFSAAIVAKELGVSRQTFWRWRQLGKIPLGHRFRDGKILYTADEVLAIRAFANHLEPIASAESRKMKFFNGE